MRPPTRAEQEAALETALLMLEERYEQPREALLQRCADNLRNCAVLDVPLPAVLFEDGCFS